MKKKKKKINIGFFCKKQRQGNMYKGHCHRWDNDQIWFYDSLRKFEKIYSRSFPVLWMRDFCQTNFVRFLSVCTCCVCCYYIVYDECWVWPSISKAFKWFPYKKLTNNWSFIFWHSLMTGTELKSEWIFSSFQTIVVFSILLFNIKVWFNFVTKSNLQISIYFWYNF